MRRAREPVTIYRDSEPEYNEAGELISAGSSEEIMKHAWATQFSSSLEFSEGRQNTVTRGILLFPPHEDVRATDRIEVYPAFPVLCRVVGEPFRVPCAIRSRGFKHLHVDVVAISGDEYAPVAEEEEPEI